MSIRNRIVVASGLALVVLAVGLVCCLRTPSEGAAAAVPQVPVGLRVLSEWDRLRSEAYASGDVAALRALYASGSATGRRDVELLRAYADRGLSVREMRMQVLACEVRFASAQRLRLVVTDRLQEAVVAGVRLPVDRASRRVVTFVRPGGRWVVAEVSAAAPRR
jgi:hypothetical protein